MHNVCQVPLKVDVFVCLLHRRRCDVTTAHRYVVLTMLRRYILQLYCKLLLS